MIRKAWMAAGRPEFGKTPLVLSATFYLPRSPSHYQKGRGGGPLWKDAPATPWRPDLSNLVKLVEDALNGCLWHDDAWIVRYGPKTAKRYAERGEEPRTELTVWKARTT